MRKTTSLTLTTTLVFFTAAAGRGSGIVELSISGNEVSAELSVLTFEADLSLEFESAVGLTPTNLGLSAATVYLPSLLSRLPALETTGITAFPVVLEIEPPSTGGLSFDGVYTLELETRHLICTAGCPWRLFKAENGGDFRDVTIMMGTGSYRVRTRSASFSEFLIVTDLRDVEEVVEIKLDRLDGLLDDHAPALPISVHGSLDALFDQARADWEAGDVWGAIDELDDFLDEVVEHGGTEVPNTWRSSRDLDNVAGELRAAAETLRFSLSLVP